MSILSQRPSTKPPTLPQTKWTLYNIFTSIPHAEFFPSTEAINPNTELITIPTEARKMNQHQRKYRERERIFFFGWFNKNVSFK